MNLLEVNSLSKSYKDFSLKDVSFKLEPGYIMGFIGRNGAGKTTTIKSMLNLVSKDGGSVRMNGLEFNDNEVKCKEQLGYIIGEFDCYKHHRLKTIAKVTKRFYDDWDDSLYHSYLKRFSIDENKKVDELSAGMRVKFALALALSHNAELFIFDEPTSGLDPVSRDDLLNVFRSVVEDGKRSILFSTHIISDLEKCADFITYIKNGSLVLSTDVESFKQSFRLISGSKHELEGYRHMLLGYKENAFGFTGLIRAEDLENCPNTKNAPADLESIMIYYEKENNNEKAAL